MAAFWAEFLKVVIDLVERPTANPIVFELLGIAIAVALFGPRTWRWLHGLPPRLAPQPPVRRSRVAVLIVATVVTGAGLATFNELTNPSHRPCPASIADVGAVEWTKPIGGGQGAYPAPELRVHLGACETLMVTGFSFAVKDGRTCSGSTTKICVLVVRSTFDQDWIISGLEPSHTWYGITESEALAALYSHVPDFFTADNCETDHGCDDAEVVEYLDREDLGVQTFVRTQTGQ